MKLLYIVDGLEGASLSEPGLWLGAILTRWVERGHDVDVIAVRPLEPHELPETVPGANVVRAAPDDLEFQLGCALERRPDVIHVASTLPFGARVVEAIEGLPLVADVHDFWPICPSQDLLRRPRLEPCAECFPYRGCSACAGLPRLRDTEERRLLLRSARAVLAHTAFQRARLAGGLGRYVDVIGYGADVERFRPDPDPPLSAAVAELFATRDVPRILWLGPPTTARGRDQLLDVLVALNSRVPGVELVLAGRDPENPDLEGVVRLEAKPLGLDARIRLVESVPVGDLPALFASARVAIAPWQGPDAGGWFALHALASGVPVVSASIGSAPEFVRHAERGYLVAPGDVAALAGAAAALLNDDRHRRTLGDRARHFAERHTLDRAVDELLEFYSRLASGSSLRALA